MAKNKATEEKVKKVLFDPLTIEPKWQTKWEKEGIYQPDFDAANVSTDSERAKSKVEPNKNRHKKPFYNLMMFPYPSAEGLHVGSMYAFGGVDVFGRFKRMMGYD